MEDIMGFFKKNTENYDNGGFVDEGFDQGYAEDTVEDTFASDVQPVPAEPEAFAPAAPALKIVNPKEYKDAVEIANLLINGNTILLNIEAIAKEHGADYSTRGAYPAWEYKKDSHLRDVMKSVYERMYGKSPEIVIIHAGLECGIFSEKIEGLDCVSIGPNNYDIHTTEERLSLSSFERVWDFLLNVLREI